jgi:hypothetical protein
VPVNSTGGPVKSTEGRHRSRAFMHVWVRHGVCSSLAAMPQQYDKIAAYRRFRGPFKPAKRDVIDRFERAYLSGLVLQASTLGEMSRRSGLSLPHLRNLLRRHDLLDQVSGRRPHDRGDER